MGRFLWDMVIYFKEVYIIGVIYSEYISCLTISEYMSRQWKSFEILQLPSRSFLGEYDIIITSIVIYFKVHFFVYFEVHPSK